MKTTPILMQPDMVRATLREIEHPGTGKTNTRRLRGLEEINGPTSKWAYRCMARQNGRYGALFTPTDNEREFNIFVASPYGGPGDLLYVRETMIADYKTSDSVVLSKYAADGAPVLYPGPEVDKDGEPDYGGSIVHWDYGRDTRPSIHMQRWASRITLPMVSVRVERLQDICEADAIAEGIECVGGETSCQPWKDYSRDQKMKFFSAPSASFRSLWESINGAGSWNKNPYVWRLEFKPELVNVDKCQQVAA